MSIFVDPGSVGQMLKHVITMFLNFFSPLMLNFFVFCLFFSWGVQRAREKEAPCKEVRKISDLKKRANYSD